MIETNVCIIGAGAAGLMAACTAASGGKNVVIAESNSAAGRKLLLTGGGRCNLTHTGKIDEFIKAYKPFDKFVRHCIHTFPPEKLRTFFYARDLETIEEPTGCVFPKTNRSSNVCKVLTDELKKPNVKIIYGTKINSIKKLDNSFIIESDKFTISAKSLIIATGGVSWPQTGSDGSGYEFAKSLGHKIIAPRACLVPLTAKEKFTSLAGVSVQNVSISGKIADKKITSCGAMIFTHTGIGGPAVLDFSRMACEHLQNLKILIDFLPDISVEHLDLELTKLFAENQNKTAASVLYRFLPKALAERIVESKSNQIDRKTRKDIIGKLKSFPLTITGSEQIEKATITRGGVDTAEIDSKTMESKICKGLFFAGEILNVDAPCGGYNLQFAFSSGFLAGIKI
jgi:predicted Rossmann fold flavoprotein